MFINFVVKKMHSVDEFGGEKGQYIFIQIDSTEMYYERPQMTNQSINCESHFLVLPQFLKMHCFSPLIFLHLFPQRGKLSLQS